MQVHTFIAESASEAVEQIRAQLGPAAVVLSVRKLPRTGVSRFLKEEQIEVVAGIEDPPAPAVPRAADPIAELRDEIRTLREQVLRERALPARPVTDAPEHARKESGIEALLARGGMLPLTIEQVLSDTGAIANEPLHLQIEAVSEALRRKWTGQPERSEAAVHVFVGVPGCGKSTVLCKMLAQASLAESQPSTVFQLDAHVTNPSSQPAIYSEILGAHFERTPPERFEWREESVFVDLPGIELGNERALENLARITGEFGVPEIHLVLNAAYESAHLLDQARFFSKLGISDLILTHLDEENRWGKIWNLVLGTNYSVRFLSRGQNIPGEFLPASAELILNRQFRGK